MLARHDLHRNEHDGYEDGDIGQFRFLEYVYADGVRGSACL